MTVAGNFVDPIKFQKKFWPNVYFYKEQREVIYSAILNDETFVPAGNMLGKDFVSAFIVVYLFLTRHPCRIVTTSAKDDHLRVLWGEIGRFIETCNAPLTVKEGGPLIHNHHELKRVVNGKVCDLSYVRGMVAGADSIASMQGHHIAKVGGKVWFECCGYRIDQPMFRTFFITDESSSVPNDYWLMARTWANSIISIGNTWECRNEFRWAVEGKPTDPNDKGGDMPDPDHKGRFYRKVIRIKGEDSPNVRYALAEIKAGKEPSNTLVVPGVLSWADYKKRRATWDAIQQCVSLDAAFYKGSQIMLYPAEWLNRAETLHKTRSGRRRAKAMGVDPAEGGDDCSWCVIDELGVVEIVAMKTPNTAIIPNMTLALMRKHGLKPEDIWLDAGGGGREHADRLRSQGHYVNTVGFGEAPSTTNLFFKRRKGGLERVDEHDRKVAYRNRRAEMYGLMRLQFDPEYNEDGFSIPPQYAELRRQLGLMPLRYDEEGQMYLPPKRKKKSDSKEECLTDLIGRSPDEADSLVLANFGMLSKEVNYTNPEVGAVIL